MHLFFIKLNNDTNLFYFKNTKALVAHIPMPGHPIGESLMEETLTNVTKIIEAIAENDVIFLLLDTREARWMPTLIAAHYGKVHSQYLNSLVPTG